MENTGVSAWTVSDLRGNGAEKLSNCILVLQVAEDNAAGVGAVVLGLGDKRLNVGLEGLCFSHSCEDPLLQDQGRRHVCKKSLAVSTLASEMIDGFIVSHLLCVLFLWFNIVHCHIHSE